MGKDYTTYFRGKKITVMGLGLLGRGVGDTEFLAECGAELIVTDKKTESELQASFNRLKGFPNITWRLSEHREEDFVERDMILKAAGVPFDSAYIEIARKSGAEIAMSGALFAKLAGIPIIGVTGTRGKSTTTQMIYHVLRQVTEGGTILLGGNVRGVSNLQLLKEVEDDSIAVMELDSWQLQGFGEIHISPHVSVFTNFMEDHMNYYLPKSERSGGVYSSTSERGEQESSAYKGAMDAYFYDKAHIFLHQEGGDTLITTREVFERADALIRREGKEFVQEVELADVSLLPEECLLSMPGEHNRLNACFALLALRAVGLTDEEIFDGLASFPGVPGRLEYLGTKNGVEVYNDNNATTPIAVVRGIEAVAEGRNVILIAGGAHKEIDPQVLIDAMQKYCKRVFFIPGTGTDALVLALRGIPVNWKLVEGATGREVLEKAVREALEHAVSGDVLLFSPGFASFGMFVNEYDRNDQFVESIASV